MKLCLADLRMLRRSDRAFVYRARASNEHDRPVILKVLSSSPQAGDVERLAHEHELTGPLKSRGVLRLLATTTHEGLPALVFEDFGGAPLDTIIDGGMTPEEFLRIAARITAALAEIHRGDVIHKDIKPENILVDPRTGEVKITGFGLATRVLRERQGVQSPHHVEGSLAYMSPEQTGRMNRAVDSRSDLYSLGVVFFEMLTGRLPFDKGLDALEWVHCHVARPAPSPRAFAPSVPEPIAAITLKLLSKTAEDRYQTASGLGEDLARCAHMLEVGSVETFPLGTQDIPDRLQLPQRLYGREREIAVLESAFHRVVASGRPELLLVSGQSGVGKSALVHELLRSIAQVKGCFITRKFEQYGGTIPNLALAQVFRPLVRELLGEDETELARARAQLMAALGSSARLLADLIPELTILLGPQPEVGSLGPREDAQRFYLVFTRFVSTFARAEQPLVLFLDDLQWSDQATLQLLEHVISELEGAPLFVIGAYRDNEVGPAHPVVGTIERLHIAERIVDRIVVPPLSLAHLTSLVADTVRRPTAEARSLAELLFVKTGGNPFFTMQFVTELSRQRLLVFDHASHAWEWDLPGIARKGYTDNVIDLMVARIRQLPPRALEMLALAASAGSAVPERLLSAISERSAKDVRRDLFAALREGLLVRAGEGYRFSHDRVQQAAYSLVPERERPAYHARIGRLLLDGTPDADLPEHVFEIVSQLEAGLPLLTPDERDRFCQLCLVAAQRAKGAAAYVAAASQLATGVSLLRADAWEARHAFAFELHMERAQCELLSGNLELARTLLTQLRERARTKRHLADVARAEIVICVAMGDMPTAVAIGLGCLRHFGIEWSAEPSWTEVQAEYERLTRSLGSRAIEELIDLPVMVDPEAADLMDLLTTFKAAALFTNGNLHCLLACRMASTSIAFGNAGTSSFGYTTFAMALVHFFGRCDDAYRFAKLAYDLTGRIGLPADRGRVHLDFAIVSSWVRPLRDNRAVLEKALALCDEGGDTTYASYTYTILIGLLIVQGAPLAEAHRVAEEGLRFARKARLRIAEVVIVGQERLILHARGRTDHFSTFDGEAFDEARYEGEASNALVSTWYYVWKLRARCLSGDYDEALAAAKKANAGLWATPAFMIVPEYHFYHALTRSALCARAMPVEREAHLAQLREERERFRAWSARCAENFLHKYALVAAETARVEGDHLEAERLYERAIASAHDQGFVANEALGLELAGRYYLDRGFARIGETYLRDARACYARWGAYGKVEQLGRLYPRTVEAPAIAGAPAIAARPEQLDLLSVMKASQSIAVETELDDLVRRLMRVVVEQSVAQRGYLLLARGGEPAIAAEARSTEHGIDVTVFSPSVPSSTFVPDSLVRYVWRTHEQTVLADASDASERRGLISDEYVARFRPKSVLCRPIVRRTGVIGLLYLENDLVTHAFSPERVAVLEVLASQAAISLEIASSLQQERRATDALLRSESRFRRLYESNMIGVLFGDFSGRITEANDYVLSLLRYTRTDLESGAIRWTDLTPAEWKAADANALEELRASRVCRPYEKQYIRKGGARVPILIGAAVLEGSEEETISFVLDMAERERLLLEERQARGDAEKALRAREEFIALAAHELRTPLTPLKLQLRMLATQLAEGAGMATATRPVKQLVGLFESADRQVDRLSRLVEDLLDASALKTWRLEPSTVDLAELAREVVERYRSAWTAAGSTVEVHAEAPVIGLFDRRRIEQVVVNLLTNAIKYGRGRPIAVTVREDSGHAMLSVRDLGIGIATEDQQRIFERFERAVGVEHFGGFGLGLHISREIVRAHGGDIRVESRLDEDACFTVDLPCRRGRS